MSHFTAILELFLSYVPSTVILEFCAFNLSMKSVVFISWQNEFNKKNRSLSRVCLLLRPPSSQDKKVGKFEDANNLQTKSDTEKRK